MAEDLPRITWGTVRSRDGTYYPRRYINHTSAREVKIMELERARFCVDCDQRYSPLCKYCDLDGTCSRHGIIFVDGKCPLCGRTFEDDWNEYIECLDKYKLR